MAYENYTTDYENYTTEQLQQREAEINAELKRVGKLFDKAEPYHFITFEIDGEKFFESAKEHYGNQIYGLYADLGYVMQKLGKI